MFSENTIMARKISLTRRLSRVRINRTMIMHPDPTRILKNDVPPGGNRRYDLAVAGVENSGETLSSRGVRTFQTFRNLKSVSWMLRRQEARLSASISAEDAPTKVVVGSLCRCASRTHLDFCSYYGRISTSWTSKVRSSPASG